MSPRGKEFTDAWSHPAQGVAYHKHIKVGAAFDEETFAYLRKRALREHTSLAEQIRLHVEWGRENIADSAKRLNNGKHTLPVTVRETPAKARSK